MVSVANKKMRMSCMRNNLEKIKFHLWYFRVPFDYEYLDTYMKIYLQRTYNTDNCTQTQR